MIVTLLALLFVAAFVSVALLGHILLLHALIVGMRDANAAQTAEHPSSFAPPAESYSAR